MAAADPDTPRPVRARSTIAPLVGAVALGLGYFFLINTAQAYLVSRGLPQTLMDIWIDHPWSGSWLISAFNALLTYWLMGASIALVLAVAIRRDFVFYGAVATGAALVMAAQVQLDGWFTLTHVGANFWLAHKIDALLYDPFGMLSAVVALPVCCWAWGRLLS